MRVFHKFDVWIERKLEDEEMMKTVDLGFSVRALFCFVIFSSTAI